MKEIFAHSNYTNADVAKTAFERDWLKSASGHQNKKTTSIAVLKRGALTGSGYAYPGISSVQYTSSEDDAVDGQ